MVSQHRRRLIKQPRNSILVLDASYDLYEQLRVIAPACLDQLFLDGGALVLLVAGHVVRSSKFRDNWLEGKLELC
jgi:hypothetical protein